MKIVQAVFEKMKILFFLWTTSNFEGRSKTKKKGGETGNICKGTPDMEFEQDWSVGIGATLRDRQKIKNYSSSFKDFSEKADSVILLGFECTINTQNLNKIVGAIFQKIEILIFFLCELPLILGVARKRKEQTGHICKGTTYTEF